MLEDKDVNGSPSQNNEFDNSCAAYIRRAVKACASGDAELGLHLYLAAYERGCRDGGESQDAAHALRKAWMLAVDLKQRSLAEYIFEKLEPLLEPSEVAVCAAQLQRMALDKLEEFGLSREDLEEMTDMISQDLLGVGGSPRLVKVEHLTLPASAATAPAATTASAASENQPAQQEAAADPEGAPASGSDGTAVRAGEPGSSEGDSDAPAARSDAQGGRPRGFDAMSPEEQAAMAEGAALLVDAQGARQPARDGDPSKGALRASDAASGGASGGFADSADAHAVVSSLENISYKDLSGFKRAVATMRDFGIGMQDDPQFQTLVSMLNRRHGFDRMPAADSFLFRSPAREDAHRFMVATLGEIGLPAIRMHMEENLQGMPILCVMAQADRHPKMNAARNAIEGPGVLLLEDLDLWASPLLDAEDDYGFMLPSLSRAAREAINLIRSAVDNPEVYVLASASDSTQIDSFFYDLLEPLTLIDIDYPDDAERREIWQELLRDHPSFKGLNVYDLVKFTAGMPRYDIYMAAREAVEDAYKLGLMQRRYVPVTVDNLFEKLAAYQPLESDEYHALEDAVVEDFRRGLDGDLDDFLKDQE